MKRQSETERKFAQRFFPENVPPRAFYEISDIVLFVHIPKTAGVSVGKALRNTFDHFHGVKWNDISASFSRTTRDACYQRSQNGGRHVIMGHFSHREIKQWKAHGLPVKAASILRDPVDRVVSNYNYNCSEQHPAHQRFRTKFPSLESYVSAMAPDVQIFQMVGPCHSFEHALEKLTADFTFLGVTEHLPHSLKHLEQSHGLKKLEEFHLNKASRGFSKGCSSETADAIRNKCENDLHLHRLLLDAFDR